MKHKNIIISSILIVVSFFWGTSYLNAQTPVVTESTYSVFLFDSNGAPVMNGLIPKSVTAKMNTLTYPEGKTLNIYQKIGPDGTGMVNSSGKPVPLMSEKKGVPAAYTKTTVDETGAIQQKGLSESQTNKFQSDQFRNEKVAQEALRRLTGGSESDPQALADKARQELEGKKKCPLAAAGQSELLGNMWGEKEVAKPKEFDPRPLREEPGCDLLIPATCAQDIDGLIATKRVSPENWQFFQKNLGVTDENSYGKLSDGGKQQVAPKSSNQKIAADSSGGRFTAQQVITPDKKGHTDALAHPMRAYTPPGSSMQMLPRDSYVAGQKTQSANGTPNDTDITDDCKFVPASDSANPATGGGGNIFNNMFKGLFNKSQTPAVPSTPTSFMPNMVNALTSAMPRLLIDSLAPAISNQMKSLFSMGIS